MLVCEALPRIAWTRDVPLFNIHPNECAKQFNRVLCDLLPHNYIKLFGEFLYDGKANRALYKPDGLHPNLKGSQLIHKIITKKLSTVSTRRVLPTPQPHQAPIASSSCPRSSFLKPNTPPQFNTSTFPHLTHTTYTPAPTKSPTTSYKQTLVSPPPSLPTASAPPSSTSPYTAPVFVPFKFHLPPRSQCSRLLNSAIQPRKTPGILCYILSVLFTNLSILECMFNLILPSIVA